MTGSVQEALPLPAFVRVDEQRGHITVAEDPFGQCDGAFVDLGNVLQWWAYTSVTLDPAGARALAAGLTRWADRDQRGEGEAAFFLIGAAIFAAFLIVMSAVAR